MKNVIDAGVALKWTLPETHSDKALRLQTDSFNISSNSR